MIDVTLSNAGPTPREGEWRDATRTASIAQAIADALSEGDRDTAHRLAHSIKSVAATIGATAVQGAGQQLESGIQENSTDIHTLISTLGEAVSAVRNSLQGLPLEEAEHDASPAETGASVPLPSLFATLRERLESGDSEAVEILKQLRSRLPDSGSSRAVDELGRFVAEYDFDAALDCLGTVEEALGILRNRDQWGGSK